MFSLDTKSALLLLIEGVSFASFHIDDIFAFSPRQTNENRDKNAVAPALMDRTTG